MGFEYEGFFYIFVLFLLYFCTVLCKNVSFPHISPLSFLVVGSEVFSRLVAECNRWAISVKDVMPYRLLEELNSMSSNKRTVFIFSGLGGAYVPGWNDCYVALCDFVYMMYNTHSNVLDNV